jgi:hypothetical protein
MNRADAHHPRPRHWPCHALFLLLPACFHTEYLQEDAGGGHDDAAGHDGAMVDDAAGPPPDAFDYASCPPSYDLALPGPTRYRLITTGARAWEHSDACNKDSSGATHLAVVETTAEIMSIEVLVNQQPPDTIAGNAVLIGGVQLKTATETDESWLGFDGRPLINTKWYNDDASNDHEPNDFDNDESNHQEQFIVIAAGKNGLNDGDGASLTKLHGALCECDGHPIAANAAAAVDSYRMP